MSTSKRSIADEVLAEAANRGPGFKPWYERLPEADRLELEQLRARWLAGELPIHKRALARAIIKVCAERGYHVTGIQGVEAWIRRRN